MDVNFENFPELHTQRLYLRAVRTGDLEILRFLRSDPQLIKYINNTQGISAEEARAFFLEMVADYQKGESIFWAITLPPLTDMIGIITLWNIDADRGKAELGYSLVPSHQHRGIMTEAVTEILRFGFEIRCFNKIEALTNHRNLPSIQMLEKIGFSLSENADPEDAENLVFEIHREHFSEKECSF